jgi:hypothetical protein
MNKKLKLYLEKHEPSLSIKDYESGIVVTTDGKELLKYTDKNTKSIRLPPPLVIKHQNNLPMTQNNFIFTHNHPLEALGNLVFSQSLSIDDIWMTIKENYAGIRAVELFYTYVLYRPENGWNKVRKQDLVGVWKKISKAVEKEWQNNVLCGKMSLRYYGENIQHEIITRLSNHYNWNYYRTKNKNPKGSIIYPELEIVSPLDLPLWLKNSKLLSAIKVKNYYKKQYEIAKIKYPKEF